MNMRRWSVVSGIVALAMLALAVGLTQAQGPEPPEGKVRAEGEVGAAAKVGNRIPVQGRLTDASGNSLNGTYDIRFSLYEAATGGTAICSDTNSESVEDGLFYSEIWGTCGSDDMDGRQLYLGVKVETDPEMTPRQAIYPVPYAMSLRPGAIISDPSDTILTVRSTGSGDSDALIADASGTGEAIEAYATDGIGLFAKSDTYVGLQAYSYETEDHPGVFGCSAPTAATCDGYRDDGAVGVMGYSSSWYAGYFYSAHQGLRSSSGDGFFAAYFVNRAGDDEPGLRVDGYSIFSGAKTGYVVDICLNEGPEPLETGDVVVVTGFSEPVAGQIPVIAVRKATEAESTGVVGVVDLPFAVEASSEDESESGPKPAGGPAHIASGTGISPGGYLSVVTLGAFRAVKVDASYDAIQPGDLLVSSPNPGYAMKASDAKPGTIIGKAMGALEEGTGIIPVLVTLD